MPRTEAQEFLLTECLVRRSRGSGPGGQHRNKTESRIELVHQPTGITVVCDDTRSQHRNLDLALERLERRIEESLRVATPRVIRTKRLRRVQQGILLRKRQRSETKRLRRKPERD